MQHIYKKIDSIFDNSTSMRPKWVDEILDELSQIKALLQTHNDLKQTSKKESEFYDFLREFRKALQADSHKEIYPEIEYKNRKLGIDVKGLLYDKESLDTLTKQEAYKVYEYFYQESLKDGFSFEKVSLKD